MVATVDEGDGAPLLGEVHLAAASLHVEVAVNKQGTLPESAPERFLPVEVEVAVPVDGCAVQCIVSTFKVAVLIIGMPGTVERV